MSHKALYSTDGGMTWATAMRDGVPFELNGWLERIELAYSRSSPNIVYAMNPVPCSNTPPAPDYNIAQARISRSTDGGQTFTKRNTTMINPRQCSGGPLPNEDHAISASWYNNTLWVSPTDSNFVVAGGYSLHKSTNGGDSFQQIGDGYIMTEQPHPDQHCIVPDPGFNGSSNKRVYVCNDGGVYRTNDITTANKFGTGGWEYLEMTYQTTQFYGAAGNGTTGLIYGGTQDNAPLRLLSGNSNAKWIYGGDGGFSAVDPIDDNYCYGEYVWLRIHRSLNCRSDSATAQDIHSGISDVTNNQANFIAPFILDPNEPNRMLAGGRSLWQTNNVRTGNPPTWTSIRPGGSDNISAIAVATGNSNIIWIAQNDGKIYKTNNGLDTNPTWTTVDDNGGSNPLPNRFVTRILIDKDNSNIAYIALGGFTGDNLQKTADGGVAWQDIAGTGLPSVPIRGIARHPNNSNKLYVGTEIGVFTSVNGGVTWDTVMDGPANVSVDELVFMSNSTTLLAATYGRGIWTTNVDEVTSTRRTLFDFDGDGHSDTSVFRPSDTVWYLNRSTAGFQAMQLGLADDKTVARDYDGDGKADIAVWRPSDGVWYRLNSSNGAFYAVQFGQQGDVPVPADFDNDGKTDEAVFRPSAGAWYLNQSTAGFAAILWGQSTDLPSAADFDGDGKADQAVFRPSNGIWYLRQSASGIQYIQFGQQGDLPVAADYDGDGKADTAVFRSGTWYLNRSSSGFLGSQWGASTDKPVPGDYDGDGKADIAVWRPADGIWHLLQSANGYRAVQFGANGDVPIPAAP
ncbi:MAG: FG-GAP-like repeat-containing protein [Pyrinomonadaceae bacterium]